MASEILSLTLRSKEQRLGLPILGRKAHAGGDGVGGAAQPNRPPVYSDRAGEHSIVAEYRLGQFRAARAHQPREADDLAGTAPRN